MLSSGHVLTVAHMHVHTWAHICMHKIDVKDFKARGALERADGLLRGKLAEEGKTEDEPQISLALDYFHGKVPCS